MTTERRLAIAGLAMSVVAFLNSFACWLYARSVRLEVDAQFQALVGCSWEEYRQAKERRANELAFMRR